MPPARPAPPGRWYRPGHDHGVAIAVDGAAFRAERGAPDRERRDDPARHSRCAAPGFGCFGLHEWADGLPAAQHRHPVPLRLGQRPPRMPSSRRARAALHALRRLPLLHPGSGAPQPRRADARPTARDASSPGACTPAWISTNGRSSCGPSCPASCCWTRSRWRARCREPSICEPRPYDLRDMGLRRRCPIETAEGKAEYVRPQRGVRRARAAIRRAPASPSSAGHGASPAGRAHRRTVQAAPVGRERQKAKRRHARRRLAQPVGGQSARLDGRHDPVDGAGRACRRVEKTTVSTMSLPAARAATALATGSRVLRRPRCLQHSEVVGDDHPVEAELLPRDAVPLRRQTRRGQSRPAMYTR